jgi:hypothetical protein
MIMSNTYPFPTLRRRLATSAAAGAAVEVPVPGEAAATTALSGLAAGDTELRRLWALYCEQDATYIAAYEKMKPVRAALDAEMRWHDDREAHDARCVRFKAGWEKYRLQPLSDAWNDAHAAMLATITTIQRTPAEGLFGIAVKLAALDYSTALDDALDFRDAVASALTDIDKLAGTRFIDFVADRYDVGDGDDDLRQLPTKV